MLLDDYLPEPDVSERHARLIRAPRAAVLAALKELRLAEMSPLVAVLFAIRGLPHMIVERRLPRRAQAARPLLQEMVGGGFVLLADAPNEMVLGLVGQPWKVVHPRLVPVATAAQFKGLSDPTLARIAVNFTLEETAEGTMLATETRVRVPDARARRCFRRYWFFIRRGSGLIRILWLRATARKAVAWATSDDTRTPELGDSESTIAKELP